MHTAIGMQSLICVAHRYNQRELLQQLLAAARVRLAGDSTHGEGTASCLSALAAVMGDVQQLESDAGRLLGQQLVGWTLRAGL